VDALPPPPPPPLASEAYVYAPGDIYPRTDRERELCDQASHPDWVYLAGLAVLDAGALWFGSSETVKYSSSMPLRFTGPALIGLTWGATVGGAWLALPKCSPEWVNEPPPEGKVRATWPLTLAFALIAGATAPIVNGIAIGSNLPIGWTTFEREMHLVVAGVAGFCGSLLPYALPPATVRAARELEKIRIGADGHGAFLAYSAAF
jgi:hypothetical protein